MVPELIALLHPIICSFHEMSGLPVHFQSFNVCASAGAVINAGADTVAESIAAPANPRHRFACMDRPPKPAWPMR
jgi:hypothetical protein